MNRRLVPDDFDVPVGMETDRYRLRMLSINDVVKDYDAVMSSIDHLKGVLAPDSPWPEGLTLEQDLIDLGWHQKEFQKRSSFAYTMMSLDEERWPGMRLHLSIGKGRCRGLHVGSEGRIRGVGWGLT